MKEFEDAGSNGTNRDERQFEVNNLNHLATDTPKGELTRAVTGDSEARLIKYWTQ
jgi:hypothetical protein